MNINRNSISNISHKLSKYLNKLATSDVSNRQIYLQKAEYYNNKLDSMGVQSGGMRTQFTDNLRNTSGEIRQRLNDLRTQGQGVNLSDLTNGINGIETNIEGATNRYTTIKDRLTESEKNLLETEKVTEELLRRITADLGDIQLPEAQNITDMSGRLADLATRVQGLNPDIPELTELQQTDIDKINRQVDNLYQRVFGMSEEELAPPAPVAQ
jgi:hypothetical protein